MRFVFLHFAFLVRFIDVSILYFFYLLVFVLSYSILSSLSYYSTLSNLRSFSLLLFTLSYFPSYSHFFSSGYKIFLSLRFFVYVFYGVIFFFIGLHRLASSGRHG